MANDDLAVTLSILRIIKRWSQSELAEAAGVTNSAISDSPLFSNASALSPQERERRSEIAQIASEGGRFASRLTRLMLELMARRGEV